jgi:hypothetical protein
MADSGKSWPEGTSMKPKTETQRLLYSRAAAAELLSISISTLDIAILRGLLPARKIGRKVLIPHGALATFSQKNFPVLWPAKVGGKTTRTGKPARVKPGAPERRSAIAS